MWTKEEAAKKNLPIYEDFDNYLNELKSGNLYVQKEDAEKFGYPVTEKEHPVAIRQKKSNYEQNYVPLYDRTGKVNFFLNHQMGADHGYDGDLACFGGNNEEEVIGYHLHMGKFREVYDVKKYAQKTNLKELTSAKIRFPLIRADKLGDFIPNEKQQKHIAGYFVNKNGRCIAVFQMDKMLEEEELRIFKKDEPKLPFVPLWWIDSFEKTKESSKKIEDHRIGYRYSGYGLDPIYDLESYCREFEPMVFDIAKPRDGDLLIAYDEFEQFSSNFLGSYKQYLSFIGITENKQVILRGPDTAKWEEICKEGKRDAIGENVDVVLGEKYGSDGIKPVNQCFTSSCVSSSGDSLCGGFCGYEEMKDGMFKVRCEYRKY